MQEQSSGRAAKQHISRLFDGKSQCQPGQLLGFFGVGALEWACWGGPARQRELELELQNLEPHTVFSKNFELNTDWVLNLLVTN